MLIFKAGTNFVLGSTLPPLENQFHDGTDSHKESILWNQCLGFLKVYKFGLYYFPFEIKYMQKKVTTNRALKTETK